MSTFLFEGNTGTEVAHLYKVNERNLVKNEGKKSNNLMLYHGTNQKGVTGILKEGFRNSEKGWFGKGSVHDRLFRNCLYLRCLKW